MRPLLRTLFGPRSALPLLVLMSACFLGGMSSQVARGEDLSSEFKRAIRTFLKEDSEKQKRGAQALRALGEQAVKELRVWIARVEKNLARARILLEELDGAGKEKPLDPTVRDFLARRLEAGWEALRKSDYEKARNIASALVALDGDSPRLFDYRRLLLATEKRMLAKEVLEPVVTFKERVYEFGEVPRLLFRLTNHSEDNMVVSARRGVLGVVDVTIDRVLFNGTQHRDRHTITIETFERAERLNIPHGQTKEIDLRVPYEAASDEKSTVVRIQVGGNFRPSQWGVKGRNVSTSLDLPEAECWLVPKGEKRLAESPLKKLEVALFFRRIEKFFTAGQLAVWAAQDDPVLNDKLTRLLIQSLTKLNSFGFTIANNLLLQTTGVRRARVDGPEFWKEWLEEQGDSKIDWRVKEIPLEFPSDRRED